MVAKLTGVAAVLAVVGGGAVILLAQLVKEGYLARSRQRPPPSDPLTHDTTEATVGLKGPRSLIIQFMLLAVVFSGILAVLTYYGAPTELFRNRVVAGGWGLFIGIPAAAAFVTKMNSAETDDE